MKTLLAALVVVVLGTGCYLHVPGAVLPAKKCPPGHTWSDGQCHDRGKGHDPAKHQK